MKKNLAKRLVAVLVICAMLMSGVCMVIANAEEDVEYRVMFANGGASAYEQMDPASSAVYGMADGEIVMACAVNADWWITESGCYIMNSDLRYEQYPAAPAEEPVVEEPVVEEPVAEEPVYEEPAYEEPAYEEPAYEAPVEEPVYVEPAPAPVVEEPVVEEPVVEEPVAEESVAEEPAAEDAEEESMADEETAIEEEIEEEYTEEDLVDFDEYETPLGIPGQEASPADADEQAIPENAEIVATLEDVLNPDRKIDIYGAWECDEPVFGGTVRFTAVLQGYDNVTYSIQWQQSSDDQQWTDIEGANDPNYYVEITEENYLDLWRVEVTITGVASDIG